MSLLDIFFLKERLVWETCGPAATAALSQLISSCERLSEPFTVSNLPPLLPLPLFLHASSFPTSMLLSSVRSTQGESAGWSQAQRAVRDMWFRTLSWCAFPQHVITLCLLTPSTFLKALISSLHLFFRFVKSSQYDCSSLVRFPQSVALLLHPSSRTRVNQMGWISVAV